MNYVAEKCAGCGAVKGVRVCAHEPLADTKDFLCQECSYLLFNMLYEATKDANWLAIASKAGFLSSISQATNKYLIQEFKKFLLDNENHIG